MERFHKRIFSRLKKDFRKLKYLDRTRASYFVVTSFIAAFCLFTGATYSYFSLTKSVNVATITVANLSYNLSSTSENYSEGDNVGVVSVGAGKTIMLDLSLESLNNIKTKYAMHYDTDASGVNVYYSHNIQNNMQGIIGARGSTIDMRIVVENKGTSDATVNLTVLGGYTKNNLATNITQGYFETDIVIRSILIDNDFSNGILSTGFPTKGGDYVYYKSSCSEPVEAEWDNEEWKFNMNSLTKQVSCDVYFKKLDNDIETYFVLVENGEETYVNEAPTSGYTYRNAVCTNDTVATYNTETRKITVSNATERTICTAYFDKD